MSITRKVLFCLLAFVFYFPNSFISVVSLIKKLVCLFLLVQHFSALKNNTGNHPEVHMILQFLLSSRLFKQDNRPSDFGSPRPSVSLVPILIVPIPIVLLLLHARSSRLLPALLLTVRATRRPITLFGSQHILIGQLRLFGQLVLVNDATLVLAQALWVGPVLLLARSKDGVEDDP